MDTNTNGKTEISATDLAAHTGDFLSRVHYGKETVVITKHGKPIATLAPYTGDTEPQPATQGLG